ncbi:MAG: pilus assembly protein PilM [Oscillospiraceae bacterium]|nr:pilus assembly protein PilM [Oscillospiraceae bacterium]
MLSFDITDRNIRIIKGTENKNKIRITSAATLNIEEDIIVNGYVKDIPRLATIINQRLKQNRMSDKEAIVSISSNMTIFKELSVSRAAKDQEFTKLVKAEMQQTVGIDDTYSISYTIVENSSGAAKGNDKMPGGGDEDKVTVLATACPLEVIDSYRRVFQMLSISLKSVMIGCNCITKVLLSDEKNRSKMPLLAVQIDNNFISVNIYANNQLAFSRFASIDPADYNNSADYVYEAVNENIFRMLQFHKSRNMNDPIRNVILYGDTKDYIRIAKDLEQMDINTSVISIPKNISGYQNLEISLYANAIGAMFSRNKAIEKVNLLDFGSGNGVSVISNKVKSDDTFNVIFAATFILTIAVMGSITFFMWKADKKIVNNIKMMEDFNNSPATIESLAIRDKRLQLQDQVKQYQKTAMLASDALKTQPYIESEVYKKIEDTIKETITQVNVPGMVLDGDNPTFDFNLFAYEDGIIKITYATLAGTKPAPDFPAALVENLQKTDYFESVENAGYVVSPKGSLKNSQPAEVEQGLRTLNADIILQVKSPANAANLESYGSLKEEGAEADGQTAQGEE